jgi:hypothetical protein
MQRSMRLSRPASLLALILASTAVGLAVLLIIRRRRDRAGGEPGEDIGHDAGASSVAAPDRVLLGRETRPRPRDEPWGDQSERRRLTEGPYRPAPDESPTEPGEAP